MFTGPVLRAVTILLLRPMGTGIPVKWLVADVPGSRARDAAPSAPRASPSARPRPPRRTQVGWQPNRRLSGGFAS